MKSCFVALINTEACACKVHNLFIVCWKAFYIKMHGIHQQFLASGCEGGARSWSTEAGIDQLCRPHNCSFFHSFGHKTCTPGMGHRRIPDFCFNSETRLFGWVYHPRDLLHCYTGRAWLCSMSIETNDGLLLLLSETSIAGIGFL